MYTNFFGFSKEPFSIVPNPEFLYLASQYKEALSHLFFSIKTNGILVITGEVGVGKTMMTRVFIEQASKNEVKIILIVNPYENKVEILQAICDDLGIRFSSQKNGFHTHLRKISKKLKSLYDDGKRVVLIIDEAQQIKSDIIEMLRLLTNLETYHQKLFQIVLVGQPELNSILAQKNLRQIEQRIIARYNIQPLNKNEVIAYINHRLSISGTSLQIFTEEALAFIAIRTKGIPRLINLLCDKALLTAFTIESHIVDLTIVKQAHKEFFNTTRKFDFSKNRIKAILLGVIIGSIVSLTGIILLNDNQENKIKTTNELNKQIISQTNSEAKQNKELIKLNPEQYLLNLLNLNNCQTETVFCQTINMSLNQLINFNYPVIINYQNSDYVLIKINQQKVQLIGNGKIKYNVSLEKIIEAWNGSVKIILEVPKSFEPFAKSGDSGEYITWLISELSKFRGEKIKSKNFDQKLKKIILDFQKKQHLMTDGIFGIASYISLLRINGKNLPSLY